MIVGQSQMVGRSICKAPAEAAQELINGERVYIAGSDMVSVRDLLKAKGVMG